MVFVTDFTSSLYGGNKMKGRFTGFNLETVQWVEVPVMSDINCWGIMNSVTFTTRDDD